MSPDLFAPFADLAAQLLPHVDAGDAAHDAGHLARVWRNMRALHAAEGGNARVLAAAVLLHDCVGVAKDSPDRARASRMAADRARQVLRGLGWADDPIAQVSHAIEVHSFSAGMAPRTIEARIVQDADRLDAIGAIGIARCFMVAASMGGAIHDLGDPAAQARPLDDRTYALDHFAVKLLKLSHGFQTGTGARMARERHDRLVRFRDDLLSEIGCEPG